MANLILTADGWQQRIRDYMGIDESYLPNTVIEQPEIIKASELAIIDMIPNYESLQGNDRVHLEIAVVCQCWVILCPTMEARLPKKEAGPHQSHELNINWEQKQKNCATERDGHVMMISSNKPSSPLLHFAITLPRRW